MPKIDFADFPPVVHIEGSTICQARCVFCPFTKMNKPPNKPRPIIMDPKIWKLVIDQFVGEKVERMSPFNMGEPYADPHLFEIIEYCKVTSPSTVISLYTNAGLLTDSAITKTFGVGVDYVHFSLGGYTEEAFEKTQPGLKRDVVYQNVLNFIRRLRANPWTPRTKYSINMTITTKNAHELADFKKYWQSEGAMEVEGQWVTNRDQEAFDQGKYDTDRTKDSNASCLSALFNHFYVLSNGDVSICCEDVFGRVIVGNVLEKRIKEIWTGDALTRIRKLHLEGLKKEIVGLCDKCIVIH